jgi:hypothetical protein
MVELRGSENLETGAERATFGIIGGINQARDARLDDGTRAHGARFESDVEGGVGEAVIAKSARGFANGDDLGVCGGIVVANRAIAGARKDLLVMDENSAYGDFASFGGSAGFVQGELHELRIIGHWWVEDSMVTEGQARTLASQAVLGSR